MSQLLEQFRTYVGSEERSPLFLCGDALEVLRELPDRCFDCCMTSPPYWKKREYSGGGLGLEETSQDYLAALLELFGEVRRTLKDTGSFWLNLGDTYVGKGLAGLPWRIAIAMIDEQQWVLRNDVVWNKLKGPDNAKDKLRNNHEYVFHFVKQPRAYYYDVDAIRSRPREASVRHGAVVSATGVTGVRYRRQLELSTALTPDEKQAAFAALDAMLDQVARKELSDFRMVIRRQQRTTHGASERLSGRARELAQRGFYFLKYHRGGSKPGDVWDLLPEDTQRRNGHEAAYPEDLCRIPLLATCPPDGVALDPFCGTGTTNLVAQSLGRQSVGIDISEAYLGLAARRCLA